MRSRSPEVGDPVADCVDVDGRFPVGVEVGVPVVLQLGRF